MQAKEGRVMDVYFIGITVVLFAASWFFMELVERV